jgi:O-antigen biosynthesis protein
MHVGTTLNLQPVTSFRERMVHMALPDTEESRNGLVFTGERFIPHQTDPLLALEHYHRYYFASRFAQNKRILDIACGEGYGSAFLSKFGHTVVGIDSDSATIEHARKQYAAFPNLAFEIGRCEDSPREGDGFDMAVSFELLEHLDPRGQVKFLENVRRVLKQDGLFVVSSPERNEYAATYKAKNEFHQHEMTLLELKAFLGVFFKHVHLCAQRVLTLSTMWQLEGWQGARFGFHSRKDLLEEIPSSESFSSPLYLIALCSNHALPDTTLAESNSFYLDILNSDQTKDFSRWAMQLNREVQKSRDMVADLQQQVDQRTAWALKLDGQVKGQNDFVEMLKKELEGRTQWALSLESDVARERAYSKETNQELQKSSQELQKSSQELLGIRKAMSSSFLYRILAKLKLIPSVWGR